VVRFIPHLKKTLRAAVVSQATLRTYEEYFASVMNTFPPEYHAYSPAPLEPHCLSVIFILQTARFQLFRHNLNPSCSVQDRVDAINRCLSVARDTAKYLTRSAQSQPPRPGYSPAPSEGWDAAIRGAASNAFCTHLWRCILVLCFRGEYVTALTCVSVCAAIGSLRKINLGCGRHVAFFLDRLSDRIRDGQGSQQQLDADEEMAAYLSADMQGSPDAAWIWTGSDTGTKVGASLGPSPLETIVRTTIGVAADGSMTAPSASVQQETSTWDGWERVERMLTRLNEEQQTHFNQRTSYYHQPQHNTGKRLHLAPPENTLAPMTSGPAATSGGTSRISIANII